MPVRRRNGRERDVFQFFVGVAVKFATRDHNYGHSHYLRSASEEDLMHVNSPTVSANDLFVTVETQVNAANALGVQTCLVAYI